MMLKVGKTLVENGERCSLKTGKRTASWLILENMNLYGPPICMIVFIFPVALTNAGAGVGKAD